MYEKYSQDTEIINVESLDVQNITANITIKINGSELKCFVSDFKDKGPFLVGEKCAVIFSLMTTELKKIEVIKEEIKNGNRYKTHCILSGEIVGFSPIVGSYYDVTKGTYYTEENADFKAGIVDCGIFVAVEILKDSDLKVGDYIKAEGRLDARKMK